MSICFIASAASVSSSGPAIGAKSYSYKGSVSGKCAGNNSVLEVELAARLVAIIMAAMLIYEIAISCDSAVSDDCKVMFKLLLLFQLYMFFSNSKKNH